MSLVACKNCGSLLKGSDVEIGYCKPCNILHKRDYTTLKEYLKLHPSACIIEVVNNTQLSLRVINKMIEEEKIDIRSHQ